MATVMDQLSTQLATISGLRTFAYVPESVQPPAAIVAFPEDYEYDSTMARGMDRMTVPIYVLVGKVHDRTSRDTLSLFVNGSGAKSFKAVLQAGTYTAFHELRVMSVEIAPFTMAGTEYLGAMFLVDIAGSGA